MITHITKSLWNLFAIVISAQVVGIIVAFSIADPCACRRDIADLNRRIDQQSAKILELYEELAEYP